MTGPEHYAEAERLAAEAAGLGPDDHEQVTLLARAQLHATPALAAATAMGAGLDGVETGSWRDAAGTKLDR